MIKQNKIAAAVAIGIAVLPYQSWSQENADKSVDDVEVIIVQATRKSAALEDIAGSLNVVSGKDIGPGGIQTSSDLAIEIPNFSVGEQFGVNRAFMRGIGFNSIDLGADGAVAFLQNGSVITRPAAQLAGFYDLSQVEVLRGPQGTLYGRGATGGVVNMVTTRPSSDLEGYSRITYGNYNTANLEGAIGGPINDKLMYRVAGEYESRDGYGTNRATGNPVDDRKAYAIRGSLLYDVNDDLEVLLVGDFFREDDFNYAFHDLGPSIIEKELLPGPVFGGQTIYDLTDNPETRDINSDQDAINDRRGVGLQSVITWRPGELKVESTTSYRQFERFNRNDLDVTDVDAFGQNNYTENSQAFTQDLTLSYSVDEWSFLGGASYVYEELDGEVLVLLNNLGTIIFGEPPEVIPDGIFRQKGSITTDAVGLFFETTYEVSPEFRLTAGGRYNHEKREGKGDFTFSPFGVFVETDKAESWNAFTPKFMMEYDFSDDLMLYAGITKGFKSGVINVGSVNPIIEPEFIWSYETGFKLHDKETGLILNGAAFFYDYTDLQVGFVNAESLVETINAASAEIWGIELDASFPVTENLSVRAFATYLNTEFTDFCNGYYAAGVPSKRQFATCPTDPTISDLSGNQMPNAPEYTLAIFADYYLTLGNSGEMDFSIGANYQDDVYFTEFNNSDAYQEGFININASMKFTPASDRWSFSLWARNLTDEYVVANNITAAPLYSFSRVGSLRPPRTFGVTLDMNF
ncbi:MAG: iron complex outermembrane receptor protein [Paraglaciecola sp.]|jgi:iron complex outermembrane receptor protein